MNSIKQVPEEFDTNLELLKIAYKVLSNCKPIKRRNKCMPAFDRSTSSTGPDNGEVNSSVSERLSRPNWPDYITTHPCSR
jgi:hypothetical protein